MDERGQQAPGGGVDGTPSTPNGQEGTTWYTTAGAPGPAAGTGPDGAPSGTQQTGGGRPDGGQEPWATGAPGGDAAADRPTWGAPPSEDTARKNRSWKKTVGAVAVAAVVVAGGVVGVNAMASSAEGTGTGTSQQRGPGGMGGYGQNGFPGGVNGVGGGQGRQSGGQFGLSAALHGDFVVSSGSSYETRRMQRGTITAIGDGTISITSDDGYSSNYTVGEVDVSSLAVGDAVVALGSVSGTTATLISVVAADATVAGGGMGQQGGTDGSGTGPQQGGADPQSGTDPQQGGTSPQPGTDPQQGGPGTQDGTGGQRGGEQAPTTSGTTANA